MPGEDHIDLRRRGDSVLLRLRVRPGASRNAVVGPHGGALKVAVTAAPERGKANRAVVRLLADRLGLAPAAIRLVSGSSSPDKTVAIEGLEPEQIRRRLG